MNQSVFPLSYQGSTIRLALLNEHHLPELARIASEPRIWEHYLYDCSNEATFNREMAKALKERDTQHQIPFVIQHRENEQLLGSTRILDIQLQHRKAEIGWTWMHPDYWATGVNNECKLLLLQYCFDELRLVRVCLKTDERNYRSRSAIEKIGARFEGVLRNDMLRDNGSSRHSAYYSILDTEWPAVREGLRLRLQI